MYSKLRFMSKQEIKDLNREFTFFYGGTFSQWYHCKFVSNNITFCNAEQYMMYEKAMLFGDTEIAEEILKTNHPRDAKKLGRLVRGFKQEVWDEFKYRLVLDGNLLKFSQNENLKKELLDTRDSVLVEASPYDDIWGIKMGEFDPNRFDPLKWRGENLLGFALTECREMIRKAGL